MNGPTVNGIERHNPERPEIDPQYKTLGRRIFAGLVDGALFFLFAITVEILLQLIDRNDRFQIYRLALLPFVILFPVITTKVWGGTPGKLYFNVAVQPVRHEGRISWPQSVLREAITIVSNLADSAALFVFYVLMGQISYPDYLKFTADSWIYQLLNFLALTVAVAEIVTASASAKRRSVHDFIAGTVVVKTGPYRKWSRVVAIGGFVITAAIQLKIYSYAHN
jgi:uncharacterized RDD family membrane protein YckC